MVVFTAHSSNLQSDKILIVGVGGAAGVREAGRRSPEI